MTIFEMAIEIRQGSQNIAANTRRKLLDPEINWLLNKVQERFIQSKIRAKKDGSGGFELDQLGTDAIRPLLTEYKTAAVIGQDGENYAQLPCDYSYLVSDDSKAYLLCGTPAPALVVQTEHILVLPLRNSTLSAAPYYAAVTLNFGTQSISLTTIKDFYQSSFSGTRSKEEKYLVRDLFLWYIRNVMKVQVYWERYGTVYAPGSFLFPSFSSGSLVVDGAVTNGTVQDVQKSTYPESGQWVPNRLSPTDKVSTLLVTSFVNTDYRSPVSSLDNQRLIVYTSESFIVTVMRLNYIRKPRKMDLVLGTDCELPEEFHQAICDLTVEYFKAMTSDPNWEVKLKDNMTRSLNT